MASKHSLTIKRLTLAVASVVPFDIPQLLVGWQKQQYWRC